MAKYRLTRPVWVGVGERLDKGEEIEIEGEPTGVYRGRVEPVPEIKPKADKPKAPPPPAGK